MFPVGFSVAHRQPVGDPRDLPDRGLPFPRYLKVASMRFSTPRALMDTEKREENGVKIALNVNMTVK